MVEPSAALNQDHLSLPRGLQPLPHQLARYPEFASRQGLRAHAHELLALWDHARDQGIGGFHHRLNAHGAVQPTGNQRSLIIQARLLYNYAEGMALGYPGAAEQAQHLFAFIGQRLRNANGWYSSLLQDEHRSADCLDTYSNAFVIVAFARYAQRGGPPAALAEGLRLLALIEEHCAPDGPEHGVYGHSAWDSSQPRFLSTAPGYIARVGPLMPFLSGNVVLHFLEALTCLYQAGATQVVQRIQQLRTFFLDHIYHPPSGAVIDSFFGAWDKPDYSTPSDFGHALEWVDFFRSVPGCELPEAVERAITDGAIRHALRENGLFQACYFHPEGRCAGGVSFWHQVESTNTFDLMATCYNDDRYATAAQRAAAAYAHFFIDCSISESGRHFYGIHYEMDANGVALRRAKGDWWKCDYHPMRMICGLLSPQRGTMFDE